jgi:hypothetical protein
MCYAGKIHPGCATCRSFLGIELLEIAPYTTRSGNTYEFSYEVHEGGELRINILAMPEYGQRDTSLEKTHRTYNGLFHFIDCGRPLADLADAKREAVFWAERTDFYIKYGMPFS